MRTHTLAAVLGLAVLAASSAAWAGPAAPGTGHGGSQALTGTQLETVQYRGGYGPGYRGYGPGPRYNGPGPRYYGPRGYAGRPYWFSRPWAGRPYFGTIVAGVALGAVAAVAIAGYAPPRPAPNLCWFWTDQSATAGYWDYCP